MNIPNTSVHEKLPFYLRIESLIRQKILSGQLEPGEKLPPEKDLAIYFDVSRITVRAALANLQSENLLIRKRGKGTFVASKVTQTKQVIVSGDIQVLVRQIEQYRVKPHGMEEMKIQETRVARDLAEFFQRDKGETVSVIRRTRMLGKNPACFLENYLLPDVAGHLSMEELSREGLQKLVAKKSGLKTGRGESYLESVPADPDVAAALNTGVFGPLFRASARIWFSSGEPFQFVDIFMRPDYFKYRIDSAT